mgnify:CR=1 FL=1
MIRPIIFATMAVSAFALTACAPPGQGTAGFRDIDWPRADHLMSASENREIEILLARLGYMRGAADGVITTSTRQAIRTYQRDIGAPVTGFVSTPLLQSLRTNAPQQAASTSTYAQPKKSKAKAAPSRRPVTTKKPATVSTVKPVVGEGGGAGGSGGGAWN